MMQFNEGHAWVIITLSFLLGVLALINSDFGKRGKMGMRIQRVEERLDRLEVLELSRSLKNGRFVTTRQNIERKEVKRK